MIAKQENNLKNPFGQSKSDEKMVKENNLERFVSSKLASQKARELMKSIMSDFPSEEEFYSHNFD